MNKLVKRVGAAAAVAALGVLATSAPSGAGLQEPITVTGVTTCDTAGAVPVQSVTWTVANITDNTIAIDSATESGPSPFNGSITLTPLPLAAMASATGSDGPGAG